MEGTTKNNKKETVAVFAHFDIEADGPTPVTSNMINIGVVFTDNDGKIIHEVCLDLQPRLGYPGDENTLKWWNSDPDRSNEYKRIMKDGINPIAAMALLNGALAHVLALSKAPKVTWVARPAAYDWMFLKCYHDLYRLHNKDAISIGFSATCLSSIREVWKEFSGLKREKIDEYFKKWTKDVVMTHNGLDDARYQARIYHGMVEELKDYAARSKSLTLEECQKNLKDYIREHRPDLSDMYFRYYENTDTLVSPTNKI